MTEVGFTFGETNSIKARDLGHVCNCIGCCRICGQCRTAPWHAGTCRDIAALKDTMVKVIARERDRLATPARV